MNFTYYLLEKSKELDKEFIVGVEERVTYKELYAKVNSLSHIINKNIGQKKEIVLLSENNLFFIIS